jgi:hypothetical protein
MSDSIDSVIVGGERSVSTEGNDRRGESLAAQAEIGKVLGLAVLLWSAECSCKAVEGQIRPGGWTSGVLKIARERQGQAGEV